MYSNNQPPIEELYRLLDISLNSHKNIEKKEFYDVTKHIEANHIANLLLNMELKSPKLTKDYIKKLHSGEEKWQNTNGDIISLQEDFDFNLLEKLGIIFFEDEWLVINAHLPNDSEYIDQTVKPILRFIKNLKNIIYAMESFQPLRFGLHKNLYHEIIPNDYVFKYITIENKEDNNYYIVSFKTRDHSIQKLISNYYWKSIFKNNNTKVLESYYDLRQSFCDLISLPDISIFDDKEKQSFLSFCMKSITDHPFYSMSLEKYKSLSYSKEYLASSLTPTKINISISIDTEKTSSKEITNHSPLSIDQILVNYNTYLKKENKIESDLDLINSYLRNNDNFILEYPFYSFLLYIINADLFINYQGINSRGRVINLLEQSYISKSLRQYLVNNIFPPFYNNIHYHLFLLSREEDFLAGFVNTAKYCQEKFSVENNIFSSAKSHLAYLLQDTLIKVALNNRIQELALLIIYLAKKSLGSLDDKQLFEYEVLKSLFDNLTDNQLRQIFPKVIEELAKLNCKQNEDGKNLIELLFLMAETCQRSDTKEVMEILTNLQQSINALYQKQFNFSQSTNYPYLDADNFYDLLPWHVCDDKNTIDNFLSLLPELHEIINNLSGDSTQAIYYRSTLRNYIQILLNLVTLPNADKNKIQIILRDLIIHTGFIKSSIKSLLLDDFSDQYKQWDKVSIVLNDFDDKDFKSIVDKLTSLAPLYTMIVLYTYTLKQERKNNVLQAIYNNRHNWNLDDNKISLSLIERLFILSLQEEQLDIAKAALEAAKNFIDTHPYKNHTHFTPRKNSWRIYEYKYNLFSIFYSQDNVQEKIKRINELQEPEIEETNISLEETKNSLEEISLFKRYLIGFLYEKETPAKAYEIYTKLYQEHNSEIFASLVFATKIEALSKDQAVATKYKQAIEEYKARLTNFSFENLSLNDKSNYINTLYLAKEYEEADLICSKLSRLDKFYKPITITYSKVLRARKNSLSAQKLVEEYKKYHATYMIDQELEEEIQEINKSIENDILPAQKNTMKTAILLENKSNDELRTLYREIKTKSITDLVCIIENSDTVEDFLYKQVLSCVEELHFRTKNLEILSHKQVENLINDWFVSLFNQRLAHFSISVSDQKRIGSSQTGKEVGETDGLFSYCNNSIAIFEAFNLTSISKNTINNHLNKIASYDVNSLSPVIIIAYCTFKDFNKKIDTYQSYIKTQNYDGFEIIDTNNHEINVIKNDSNTAILSEHRKRGNKSVTIYHFLMNLKTDSN